MHGCADRVHACRGHTTVLHGWVGYRLFPEGHAHAHLGLPSVPACVCPRCVRLSRTLFSLRWDEACCAHSHFPACCAALILWRLSIESVTDRMGNMALASIGASHSCGAPLGQKLHFSPHPPPRRPTSELRSPSPTHSTESISTTDLTLVPLHVCNTAAPSTPPQWQGPSPCHCAHPGSSGRGQSRRYAFDAAAAGVPLQKDGCAHRVPIPQAHRDHWVTRLCST